MTRLQDVENLRVVAYTLKQTVQLAVETGSMAELIDWWGVWWDENPDGTPWVAERILSREEQRISWDARMMMGVDRCECGSEIAGTPHSLWCPVRQE